jgi:poly(A) polymerase/tRNA nucleotidyltransferase (CCA-adding enzyme)
MYQLPSNVTLVLTKLHQSGFDGFVVGGSLRDFLLHITPKDWDIATNAKPDQIQAIFPDSFYENDFGTVGIKFRDENDTVIDVIETTTYRTESDYEDSRHPKKVTFIDNLEQDLQRRDFTINAMAMDLSGNIIDPFNGQKDLANKMITTVGHPDERFGEDALRLMRAIRFACQLDFEISPPTFEAIQKNAEKLSQISIERIQNEFDKIVMSSHPMRGVELLEKSNLLNIFLPELREGIGCGQNKHHIYSVWEHNVRALQYSADQNYSLVVRLSSLFHDIGKPRTKQGDGYDSTFYQHDIVGAQMTYELMNRMRYPKDITKKVSRLVRYHLFYYDMDTVSESSVRKLLLKLGKENIQDLIKVREADRIGSGTPKAKPYRLRHFEYIVDKLSTEEISAKMLKINGNVLIKAGIKPGPEIGNILNILLGEILEDLSKNNPEYLLKKALELHTQSPKDLQSKAKKIIQLKRQEQDWELKSKHHLN